MTPTSELRTRLRKLLNEVIPKLGQDSDTKFLDVEIDELLMEANNIYDAASTGWTIKAGLLQQKIESYSAGQEKYDMTSLKDEYQHALEIADRYSKMSKAKGGSIFIKITPPEVL